MGVLPEGCVFRAFFEGLDDGRAPLRLHRDHAGSLRTDPADGFELIKGFPHPNEARAPARGVENNVRQLPAELLGQL